MRRMNIIKYQCPNLHINYIQKELNEVKKKLLIYSSPFGENSVVW